LHRLLVEEEDKFGHNSEALGEIEKLIDRAKAYANRQRALAISIERDGRDATQAQLLFTCLCESLALFENQREKILINLRQSRL